MAQEPVVICKYSRGPGAGKTTDDIYTWAGCGRFLAQPGALRTAETVCGISITDQITHTMYMEQVPALISETAQLGYKALVVDDASLIFGNTFALANSPTSHFAIIKSGELTGFDRGMWSYFRRVMNDVAMAARWAGIHVSINSHEQDAFTDTDGSTYPIGPFFGWKKLVGIIPFMVDECQRATDRPPGVPPWDTRVDCDESIAKQVYMKGRLNGTPPYGAPMNTGELLRSRGFTIPRPAGLEWVEDWAEAIATSIVAACEAADLTGQPQSGRALGGFGGAPIAGPDNFDLKRQAIEEAIRAPYKAQLVSQGVYDKHIAWALRDGTHRARFRIYQSQSVLGGF